MNEAGEVEVKMSPDPTPDPTKEPLPLPATPLFALVFVRASCPFSGRPQFPGQHAREDTADHREKQAAQSAKGIL